MATAGGLVPARFDDEPLGLDIGRYRPGSRARLVAEEAHERFEAEGVPMRALMAGEEKDATGPAWAGW